MTLIDKMSNAKKVFSNTKSRLMVFILIFFTIAIFVISYVKFKQSKSADNIGTGSAVAVGPDISSIPGLGQPTREYAKLQEQENEELAAQAAKRGSSAIPTVVRSTYLDAGVSSDLSKKSGATSTAGCGVEELARARKAGVTAAELRCRGCSLAALKAAGYTAAELRAAGFSTQELRDVGFSAAELRAAGFSAKELAAAGFSATELAAAGFTAGELKDVGFSADDLRAAGITGEAINAAGFNSKNASSKGDCSIQKLQEAHKRGVSVVELKKLGCSAAALRAAGYTAAELKAAGFSAKELKDAGFSAAELRAAGFSAKELRDAGLSAAELRAAGFSAKELRDAGFGAGELRDAGFSAGELKSAGFSARELKDAGFNAVALKDVGFSTAELKASDYTDGDLVRAGIAVNLGGGESSATSTCSVEGLRKAKANGVSATELKKAGCSAAALKAAGYTAKELRGAGFSTAELRAAGFSAAELRAAGFGENDLKNADLTPDEGGICSVENLRRAHNSGVTASQLKAKGCSIVALKAAGYTAAELKDAGFSAAELRVAGFAPDELQDAGFNDNEMKAIKLRLAAEAEKKAASSLSNEPSELLGRLTEKQMADMTAQELIEFMRRQQALMSQQASELFAAWTPMPQQQYVKGEEVQAVPQDEKVAAAAAAAAALQNVDIYKAGTILFAVLDAEVNTDENTPVMATIIQGVLKDSKILGNFQRVDKKVLLQFSVLSVPRLNNSIAINATAIDPNTAKTALASQVNSHYLLRYGTLLGSAFVSGLGKAFQTSGSQTTTTPSGTITTMPRLNLMQKLMVGAGDMAKQLETAIAPNANRQPTIKVAAGSGIGLLLVSDLSVPKS